MKCFETIKEYKKKTNMNSPHDIYKFMKDIKDIEKELFVVFYLDTKNNIIAREIISIGTLNSAIIHPREVFRNAIVRNCNSIILSHNHPSGDVEPSQEDITITKRLKEAGEVIGIKVLDHVIVGDKLFNSII